MTTILIDGGANGPQAVNAPLVIGALAVTPSKVVGAWAVTHVRSGYAINSDWLVMTLDEARELAARLVALRLDWNFTPAAMPKNVKRALKETITAFCAERGLPGSRMLLV